MEKYPAAAFPLSCVACAAVQARLAVQHECACVAVQAAQLRGNAALQETEMIERKTREEKKGECAH